MNGTQTSGWRRPSKALLGLMVGIGCLWVVFAVSINWAGAGVDAFKLLMGDSTAVLEGQVWRLLTASLLHEPQAVFGIVLSLLMLYFFATPLSERWGDGRLMLFLFGSAAFAFLVESVFHLLMPTVAQPGWYGSMAMAEAATVAWALGARGEIVRFYFVIPMRPMVMVAVVAGFHVLALIARSPSSIGVFAPFAAMLAGWQLSDNSPLRRLYLKLRLKRLQAEVSQLSRQRSAKAKKPSHLRVIPGGSSDDDDDKGMLN